VSLNIIDELRSDENLFPDEVMIERWTHSDEMGTSHYGAPFRVIGRIVGRIKVVADTDGRERVSGVQLTVAGDYSLQANDRFTLPMRFSAAPHDPYDLVARQPTALSVDHIGDEYGAHHEVVNFGNAKVRTF
jgi:hypothetical protein